MAGGKGRAQQAAIAIHKKEAAGEQVAPKRTTAGRPSGGAPKKAAAKKSAANAAPAPAFTKNPGAAKDTAAKAPSKRAGGLPKAGKDPEGGLTAAGRRFFNEQTGAHLRPGVKGAADTPEKQQRKGSFLTRHFTTPPGPVAKDGKPTRQALQAAAWGEPVPKSEADEKKLAAKGRKLLAEAKKAKAAG